jgi:hypothetical protein
MTLPEIEADLKKIAFALNLLSGRLQDLLKEIPRRKPTRRSKSSSTPMTPVVARAIRATAKANPDWSYVKIARVHNVNPGRVSEVLRGKRK